MKRLLALLAGGLIATMAIGQVARPILKQRSLIGFPHTVRVEHQLIIGNQKLDSLVTLEFDSLSNQWVRISKEEYGYDINGYQTLDADYYLDMESGKWTGGYRAEYASDDQGNKLMEISSFWNDSTGLWKYSSKNEHIYQDGLISNTNVYWWDQSADQWTYKGDWLYEYDNRQLVSMSVLHTDYNADGVLNYMDWLKYNYTYDASGNVIRDAWLTYDNETGAWTEYHKALYEYNSKNKLTTKNTFYWDDQTKTWEPNYRNEIIYDTNGNPKTDVSFDWDADIKDWVGRDKSDFDFDSDGNLNSEIYSYWDIEAKQFKPDEKSDFNFDKSISINDLILPDYLSGLFKYKLTDFRISSNYDGAWVASDQVTAYYSGTNITGNSSIPLSEMIVYPNPTNDLINFNGLSISGHNHFELYNGQGKIVLMTKIPDNGQVNIKQVPGGLYFFKLISEKAIHTGKLIIK